MNRTKKVLVVVLMIGVCCSGILFAVDAGLVIRSPLFGGQQDTSVTLEKLEVQSFTAQLGLLPKTDVNTDVYAKVYTDAEKLQSAISNSGYPVTPGDTFRLVYLDGMKSVTVDLQADENRNVTIPGLGTIKGAGLTFGALRQAVYTMVTTYHSYSNPQLVFLQTGSFMVSVIGEVQGTRVVPAWGLSRLSEVIQTATPYASTRSVMVRHVDGTEASYDLYRAMRKGALDQDPLLKSGDLITLKRADKMVVLAGQVYQGGTYQILPTEGLKDLLTNYGGGVLSSADVQNIRVQRYNPETGTWYVQYVNLLEEPDFKLANSDQVVVDVQAPSVQTVTIEGAVSSTEVYDALSSTALVGYPSGRIFYQFYPGESMKQMLTSITTRFLTVSDLEGAYLLRDGHRIPINIEQILSGQDSQQTVKLQSGDSLTIPFTQRLINVSGGVQRPGVFAYVPDKTVNYYISLAGGLSDDASYPTNIKITGPDGKKMSDEAPLIPESTITVAKDTLIKDIAPTVAIIGLVSSLIGIVYTVFEVLVDAKAL